MDEIWDQLGNLEVNNFERKAFVPYGKLEIIFTDDSIKNALRSSDIRFYDIDAAVTAILKGGLRTFATLVAIRYMDGVDHFLRTDPLLGTTFDSKLPLNDNDIERYIPLEAKQKMFLQYQWKYIAPVVTSSRSHTLLHPQTVMPFINPQTLNKRSGFGEVSKVSIPASHHNLADKNSEITLICKKLARRQSEERTLAEDFEHEIHILSALCCLRHPNIIELVSAFTIDLDHIFLFPVAEGDLKDLLSTTNRPSGLQTNLEILESLWGLSSALESVHNYFLEKHNVNRIGCHYDIKPRNILYSKGKLLLTDFGLSRLRNEESGSKTTFQSIDGPYLAPECEDATADFNPGKVGRASDIWSFGCVLTEILAYIAVPPTLSPTNVIQYYQDRKVKLGNVRTTRTFYDDNGVNSAVTVFLNSHIEGSASEQHSTYLSGLGSISKTILQYEPDNRPSAEEVTRYLFHNTQRALVSELFDELKNNDSTNDISLQVEYKRLFAWYQVTGLDKSPLEIPSDSWFASSHSLYDYQHLQNILKECVAEVKFIMKELKNDSRPPFYLYQRLQRLVNDLWNSESSVTKQKMESVTEEHLLDVTLDTTQHHQAELSVDDLLRKMQDTTLSGSDLRRILCLKTMRDVASAMKGDVVIGRNSLIDKKSLQGDLKHVYQHSVRSLAPTGSRVIIEKLAYAEAWVSCVPELMERVSSISTLRSRKIINEEIPVLNCIGYYHDESAYEFGIVYELPTVAVNTDPITLFDAFKLTQSRSSRPSLTQSLNLATSLASHILDLHRGEWLHKSVSSYNIICFPEAFSGKVAKALSSVYFIGFNNSRINIDNAFSSLSGPELDYQHPVYLDSKKPYIGENGDRSPQRFRQEFDYYSVGMVLIEIALWTSIEKISKLIGSGSPRHFQDVILSKYIPLAKTYMGDTYGNAAKYCLTCYDLDNGTPQNVRENFRENVIDQLKKCYV